VVDGKIYAIGGHQGSSPWRALATVDVYNPSKDTWNTASDMLTGKCCHGTGVVDGKIYAIGGYMGTWLSSMCMTVEEYDPSKDDLLGVERIDLKLPQIFALHQNYPNPFNPRTVISWQLAVGNRVDLSIYNMLGQKVATLARGKQQAGFHTVEWNASGFASGVYLYRLQTGDYVETKKMVLIR
jgi:hypothetical protein